MGRKRSQVKIDPTKDQRRVSPEGRMIGRQLAALADHNIKAKVGLADKRCGTCALRVGTVPNGCAQTMADVVKCIVERQDFSCHQDKSRRCAGFAAVILSRKDVEAGLCPWDFSPPD